MGEGKLGEVGDLLTKRMNALHGVVAWVGALAGPGVGYALLHRRCHLRGVCVASSLAYRLVLLLIR